MNRGSLDPTEHLLRRALVNDRRFTYEDIGSFFGVSRQAVEFSARRKGYRPAWRTSRKGTGSKPDPHLVPREDLRRIRELVAAGMTRAEAARLLDYGPKSAIATRRRLGHGWAGKGWCWKDGLTWRGWKTRWQREIAKLVASSALASGATLREAAEVSGLSSGSISAWKSRGELPAAPPCPVVPSSAAVRGSADRG